MLVRHDLSAIHFSGLSGKHHAESSVSYVSSDPSRFVASFSAILSWSIS
jgi:hypothetical protein